ncbi:MAG: class I SAM-dependent methyltransferase [Rhizobiaceae bacterium]
MPDTKTFWDRVARKYAASPIKNMDGYNQTMDRVRVHLSNDDHVLEVGCGSGSTALLLASEVTRITASDISSEMIAIGGKKAAEQQIGNVDFVQAVPQDDAFPDAPFDTVLAFNFLHLVADLPATLQRLHELLKPGGMLISKTAALGGRGFVFKPLLFVMRAMGKAPPDVGFFTPNQLEAMMIGAGFEIVETRFHGDRRPFIVARRS